MLRARYIGLGVAAACLLMSTARGQSLADLAYLAAKNQQLQAQIDGLSASKGSHSTTEQSRAQSAVSTPASSIAAPQQPFAARRGMVMAPSVPPPPPAPPPPSQRHEGAQPR